MLVQIHTHSCIHIVLDGILHEWSELVWRYPKSSRQRKDFVLECNIFRYYGGNTRELSHTQDAYLGLLADIVDSRILLLCCRWY